MEQGIYFVTSQLFRGIDSVHSPLQSRLVASGTLIWGRELREGAREGMRSWDSFRRRIKFPWGAITGQVGVSLSDRLLVVQKFIHLLAANRSSISVDD